MINTQTNRRCLKKFGCKEIEIFVSAIAAMLGFITPIAYLLGAPGFNWNTKMEYVWHHPTQNYKAYIDNFTNSLSLIEL